MSEDLNNEVELNEVEPMDTDEDSVEVSQEEAELEALKARAALLGIKVHPKSGADKIRKKIEMQLMDIESIAEEEAAEEVVKPTPTKRTRTGQIKARRMTPAEFREYNFELRKRDAAKLIRIRATCMNPNKKGWEGEIISCGSAKLGTFKKFVKFDADEGWHVPNIIFQEMKERKYTTFINAKGPRGETVRRGKLVPEFAIEVLPPLTQEERMELMRKQALANGQSV